MEENGRKQLGVALLGLGRAGTIHLLNLLKLPIVKLLWMVDLDVEKVEKLKEEYFLSDTAVITPDKVEMALVDSRVDAVIVCTTTFSHEDLVKLSLAHGKAVFCEKPIAEDLEGTKACYEAARKANKPLFCSFNRRFDPSVKSIRERVQRGEIGGVHVIKTCSRDSPLPTVAYLKISGGMFHDCAVHDIDMVCWIIGEYPETVFSQGHCQSPEIAALNDLDTITILMKFPSGIMANIDLSRHSAYGYDQRIEVLGWKGMLVSENQRPDDVINFDNRGSHANPLKYSFPERYAESYVEAMKHFIRVVQGKEECSISAVDTISVSEIASACEESAKTGKQVVLSLTGIAKDRKS